MQRLLAELKDESFSKNGNHLARNVNGVSHLIEVRRMPEFEEEDTCAWDVSAEVRSAEFDHRTWPKFIPSELPEFLLSRKLRQARGNMEKLDYLINLAPATVTIHLADWFPRSGLPAAHRESWRDGCDLNVKETCTHIVPVLHELRDTESIVHLCDTRSWKGQNVESWVMYKLGTERVRIWKGDESLANYKARYLSKLFEMESANMRK